MGSCRPASAMPAAVFLLPLLVEAFLLSPAPLPATMSRSCRATPAPRCQAKGFGKKVHVEPKKKAPPSASQVKGVGSVQRMSARPSGVCAAPRLGRDCLECVQVRRDQAASDFDKLKSSGAPEYMVSIRTVGEKTSDWMPVGGIAVPRSGSEDAAVSMAIFNNEDELLKGAFRNFPRLKVSTDKFEYGYRM